MLCSDTQPKGSAVQPAEAPDEFGVIDLREVA